MIWIASALLRPARRLVEELRDQVAVLRWAGCARLLKPCRSRSTTKGERKWIAVGVVNLDRSVIAEAVGARELSRGSDYNAAGKGTAIVIAIGDKPGRESVAWSVLPHTVFCRPESVGRNGRVSLSTQGAVSVEGHEGRK